jgi:predicted ATPase
MTQVIGERLFVVSGCSGSGKSTLISALAAEGEAVAVEPGREIVKEELRAGRDGLPWANRQRFIDLCAQRTIRDFYRHVGTGRRTFFDRSFIDVASAVELTGLATPTHLETALRSKRYAPIVFMSAPWQALFRTDAERRHGFSDAVAEYEVLVPTYRRHGYEIILIPQGTVPERAAFVRSVASARDAGAAKGHALDT